MLYLNKFGSLMRKKLSDITNSSHHLQEQQKPPEDTTSSNSADKDCIQQLLKERMTLLKLLAEKKKNLLLFSLIKIGNSKIIEWTKAEMQMLRGNVQKLQLQNWNLAQSNTHMLAAEASGKFQMAIEKMVEGRLRKYFEEVVLMEQKFIVNDTMNAKTAVLDNLSKEVGSLVRVVSAVILYFFGRLEIVSNCNLHTTNKDSVIEEPVSSMGVCLSARVKVESPYNTSIPSLILFFLAMTLLSGNAFFTIIEFGYLCLHNILHDWDDEECLKILKNCCKAIHRMMGRLSSRF
ncbi:hypothetical protein Ahy_B06g082802 [Arachis hypogaea]|uniref:Uncharacterized protein n=1 Tax=Arachis hypogaea TaxID=3818 RepID=A0A444YNX6_ARAHY|nr:hypothetical protein Ahy_B06g082802 [Arachis hypogaea]